jgi:hypothetical protein
MAVVVGGFQNRKWKRTFSTNPFHWKKYLIAKAIKYMIGELILDNSVLLVQNN